MKFCNLMTLAVSMLICLTFPQNIAANTGLPKNFEDKNEVLSFVAKAALDFYLQDKGYGELQEFSINNKTKKFFFKTKLKGEEKFLSVIVNRYDIIKENSKYFFVAKGIVTDREWLNMAAKNFLEEKKIEIPAKYSLFMMAAM